jgi:hypothetical protein
MNMSKSCFNCGSQGSDMYGFTICDPCKADLKLFSDETIKKHIARYKKSSSGRTYEQEIQYRLDFVEKDYIKKKIKLLHILDRLEHLK